MPMMSNKMNKWFDVDDEIVALTNKKSNIVMPIVKSRANSDIF